jgi:hypothetical protein
MMLKMIKQTKKVLRSPKKEAAKVMMSSAGSKEC